jgi:hypothetical protein
MVGAWDMSRAFTRWLFTDSTLLEQSAIFTSPKDV